MNRSLRVTVLFILTMGFSSLSPSWAVMKGLSTDELVRSSETVVIGEVEDAKAQWSNDGKVIFTSATLRVSEVVAGKALPGKIVVEYEGGEIGDIGLKVSDVATLTRGEKVLLFLRKAASKRYGSAYVMTGKAQGKYRIDGDGTARKEGFSIADGEDAVDNDIPVDALKEKIRGGVP